MGSSLGHFDLHILFTLLNLSSSSSPANPPAPVATVYEILLQHGLPSGLLPDSVRSYRLAADGRFEVSLQKPCYVQFEYLVYYEEIISGKLELGCISDLNGIQVRRFLFFWFHIDQVRVDLPPSDSIYFSVGFFTKRLHVDHFFNVRSCKDHHPASPVQLMTGRMGNLPILF